MTSFIATFRILVLRLMFKGVEFLCRITTWFRPSSWSALNDHTRLLLLNETPPQQTAQQNLRTQATWVDLKKLLIVIPYRDRWDVTSHCLETLRTQELDDDLSMEIILVDNGSTEEASLRGLKELLEIWPKDRPLKPLRVDAPFNFSRLNNLAVSGAADFKPDLLLFLNNDVELKDRHSLKKLVAFARCCPQLGALGATLLYPNGTIQHLFAAPGIKLVAAHPLRRHVYKPQQQWYQAPRPVAAVTGALLMVKAEDFARVGGLDEQLPTLGQDIDLCLKLQKEGLCNWVLPQVVAVHHESISRGLRLDRGIERAQIRLISERWGDFLTSNPYFSRRLSRWSETPALSVGEGKYPYYLVL